MHFYLKSSLSWLYIDYNESKLDPLKTDFLVSKILFVFILKSSLKNTDAIELSIFLE